MTMLPDFVARIPRFWLFAIAGIIQVFLIALMVGDRVRILRSQTEVIIKTRAVDPHDFLRGDYVVLNYDISSVPAGAHECAGLGPRHRYIRIRRSRAGPTGSIKPCPYILSRLRSAPERR